MGKGGAGKQGGRQVISGPRQIGTITEWKGTFGFIKPLKPISHPNYRNGKVYLSAEDVKEELDGVGAEVSFQLYSNDRGLGAADCRMATAAAKAAARNGSAQSSGKVPATWSAKGAGRGKAGGKSKLGASSTASKFGASATAFKNVKGAGRGKGITSTTASGGKVGATWNKGAGRGKSSTSTTFSAGPTKAGAFSKFNKAVGAKMFGVKTVAPTGKVPATWSKSGNLQKKSVVQQTAWQKPRLGFQKGSFAKGFAKGQGFGKGSVKGSAGKGNAGKGNAGKGGGKQHRDIIYDKPLIGTVTQWKGKFGWIKPKDTIDHPMANKHKGDLFLSQEDVEQEINGVGSKVRFMLYQDQRGLGAGNVKPAW